MEQHQFEEQRKLSRWDKTVLVGFGILLILFFIDSCSRTYSFYQTANAEGLNTIVHQDFSDRTCGSADPNFDYIYTSFIADRKAHVTRMTFPVRKVGTISDDLEIYFTNGVGGSTLGTIIVPEEDIQDSAEYPPITIDWTDQNIIVEQDEDYAIYFIKGNFISGEQYRVRYTQENIDNQMQVYCSRPGNYEDFGSVKYRLHGVDINQGAWIAGLIPTAYATSTCTFVSDNNTTTMECSDPQVINRTQDLFNGLILTFGILIVTVIGIDNIINKRKRING